MTDERCHAREEEWSLGRYLGKRVKARLREDEVTVTNSIRERV